MHNLVIIDDEEQHRRDLVAAIRTIDSDLEIRDWSPNRDKDVDPYDIFHSLVDDDTVLVITDHDLTKQGPTGLFGDSIVTWCQMRSTPVGDFSRHTGSMLPEEPNQYEIRVPVSDDLASARFIVGVYKGFLRISEAVARQETLLTERRSPVALLASILGRPREESQFSLYGVRLGASNPSLQEHIRKTPEPRIGDKQRVLAYIIGHLLLNVVLKYPGPILTEAALSAYCACGTTEYATLAEVFADARYAGPFDEITCAYWSSDVEDLLETFIASLETPPSTVTEGELNRIAVESQIGRSLDRFACERCQGQNGGFWCPFTRRPVCVLSDCSVSSNAWIPQGARACRIERGFYDEWAPVLGY